MFCKWCGNTIQTTDAKCPSCGRETPALSNCGGFYDLKHKSAPQPAPQPAARPAAPVQKPDGRLLAQLQDAKKLAAIAMIVACVAAALCTILLFSNISLSSRLHDIQDSFADTETLETDPISEEAKPEEAIKNSTEAPTESSSVEVTEESTEETEAEEPTSEETTPKETDVSTEPDTSEDTELL